MSHDHSHASCILINNVILVVLFFHVHIRYISLNRLIVKQIILHNVWSTSRLHNWIFTWWLSIFGTRLHGFSYQVSNWNPWKKEIPSNKQGSKRFISISILLTNECIWCECCWYHIANLILSPVGLYCTHRCIVSSYLSWLINNFFSNSLYKVIFYLKDLLVQQK